MEATNGHFILPSNANITNPPLKGGGRFAIAKSNHTLNLTQNASTEMSQVDKLFNFSETVNPLNLQIKRTVNLLQRANTTMNPSSKVLGLQQHTAAKPELNTFMSLPVAQTLGIFLGGVVIIVLIIAFAIWIQCRREARRQRIKTTYDEENRLRVLPSRRDPSNSREKIDDAHIVGFPGSVYQRARGGVMRPAPIDRRVDYRRNLYTIQEEEEV